jgi:hypothetical protein
MVTRGQGLLELLPSLLDHRRVQVHSRLHRTSCPVWLEGDHQGDAVVIHHLAASTPLFDEAGPGLRRLLSDQVEGVTH